jgi:hypothetical protein
MAEGLGQGRGSKVKAPLATGMILSCSSALFGRAQKILMSSSFEQP